MPLRQTLWGTVMDNHRWIRALQREIGELESMLAKAASCNGAETVYGASMLKRILRRRRYSLWCFQQAGNLNLH